MKKNIIAVSTIIILSFFVIPSFSEVVTNEQVGIKMNIPDGWKWKGSGKDLEIASPDEKIMILFSPVDASNIKSALEQVDKEMKKVMTDIKEGKPEQDTLNGMPIMQIEGTAKMEGIDVGWGVYIIMAKKPVMVLMILFPGAEKHQKTLDDFSKSIQKTETEGK